MSRLHLLKCNIDFWIMTLTACSTVIIPFMCIFHTKFFYIFFFYLPIFCVNFYLFFCALDWFSIRKITCFHRASSNDDISQHLKVVWIHEPDAKMRSTFTRNKTEHMDTYIVYLDINHFKIQKIASHPTSSWILVTLT